MPRSLRVQDNYLLPIKASLLRNGFPSQKVLAESLGIAQSTVSHFLNGKPVDYLNFVEICQALGKEWRDIADLEESSPIAAVPSPRVKVVISEHTPNQALAHQIQSPLCRAGHEVTIAQPAAPASDLMKCCDYFLLVLSHLTTMSELLLEEVRLALDWQEQQPGKLGILPIWVDSLAQFPSSWELLQLLQDVPAWGWPSTLGLSLLTQELLKLFQEHRLTLPTDHELAVHWSTFPSQTRDGHRDRVPAFPPNAPALVVPFPLSPSASSPLVELPGGQIPLGSRFYCDRPPIEQLALATITQPGALIRIKAPRQMGKSSLLSRILDHAERSGSRTVNLSLQLANRRVFETADRFIQWFAASVGQALGHLDVLGQSWQLADLIGANQCCKAFFEQVLLADPAPPLTLGLDEVDRVFESTEIADDFLGLLRALHEEGKRRPLWQKFRLVVVHSTEVYIPLDMNKSPFNVGWAIDLPEFTIEQVQELASHHGLCLGDSELVALMNLVGGHPHLTRLALYHRVQQEGSLSQLLTNSMTEAGIYGDHLRRHLWNLHRYPDLLDAYTQVVHASNPVRLPSELAFKLNSMGLVSLQGNDCRPRFQLYEQYFRDRLG